VRTENAATYGADGGIARAATCISDKAARGMGSRPAIVAACCSAAVAQGGRPGMPLVEAQSLVRKLGVAPYDPAADRRALVKCAEACERFSPRIALEDRDEPECLLFDISNLEHLWKSEAHLVRQVQAFVTKRGYLARLALGDTIGAAWAAAHFPSQRVGSYSSPRKEEEQIPNVECRITNEKAIGSSFVIPHSSLNLPLQSLRIAEETTLLLRELGVETVGQLMALPRDALAARFGDELLLRLDQWTGAGREVIEPCRALPALEASYVFEEPTGDRTALAVVLRELVNQLAQQLAARDQGAVRLVCSLRYGSVPRASLQVGLLQPSASPRQLWELVELHLETVALAGEVDRVELRAAITGRLGERQGELFAARWPTDPHLLAVLVNRLSSRLGHDRVLRARPRASPVPERAMRWVSVMEQSVRREARGARKKIRNSDRGLAFDHPQFRVPPECRNPRSILPLRLYPVPQPVEVVCIAPDGPPQFVWLEQRREPIVACAGPERIETLWWRGPSVRRDYYRAATEAGAHLWMFRQLPTGRWFVHGIFE